MKTMRLIFVYLVIAGAFSFTASAAAQDRQAVFPVRPVKIVVPYPPGNTPDTLARSVASQLGDAFGQPFVVDNRPGAGGVVAVDFVAKSLPDGHTLLLGDPGPIVITPAVNDALPYNVARDFIPVSVLVTSHFFLVVPASLGVFNVADLVRLAKARPGTLNYASTGSGNIHHLMMETFKAEAGIDLVHVPYKGGSQAVPAMLGGEVSVSVAGLSSVVPHVKSGALKILAVLSPRRVPQLPDIPTLVELGYPGMTFSGDIGIFAPIGTPAAIVAKLGAEMNKAVRQAATVRRLEALGIEPLGTTPEEAAAYWKAEGVKYARAAKLAGLKK